MKKIIIAVMLALILAPSTWAITGGQLKNHVWDFLDDAEKGFWTDSVVTRMLNLALYKYSTLGFVWRIDTLTTDDSVDTYALNTDFIKIRGVGIIEDGRQKAMHYQAFRSDDPSLKSFGTKSAPERPMYYTITADTADSAIQYYMVIDPPDFDADTSYTIIVHYCAMVNLIVNDSTIIYIPTSGVPLVVMDAAYMCLVRNREDATAQQTAGGVEKMATNFYQLLLAEKSEPEAAPVK